MWQDILKINLPFLNQPLTIHGFGLMLVLGLFAAMSCAKFLARRSRLNPEHFVNAAILALVSGIIGARLSHVIENLGEFTRSDRTVLQNLMEVINIPSGGLTYYGGFLLAFPMLVIYGLMKKIPIRLGMDIIAPCLMIGLGFGRVGCFLNGCCYGAQCTVPWGVHFPYYSYAYQEQVESGRIHPPDELLYTTESGRNGLVSPDKLARDAQLEGNNARLKLAQSQKSLPVHPAQLYNTVIAFLIAGICVGYFTFRRFDGTVFALMMILESISRFLLETIRSEPAVTTVFGYHWSVSMRLSVFLFVGGILLWIIFATVRRNESLQFRLNQTAPG